MAKVTGKDGGVYIGASKIAELANWSLDMGADDVDVTSFDSEGWKEFLAGLKEWSGSAEGNYDPTDTAGQKAILNAWLNGEAVTLDLKVNSTITFSGSALCQARIETLDDKVSLLL